MNTILTINVLNNSKNWVMKWSLHRQKGKFTRVVAGKHEIIFEFIKNYPKTQSIEVVQLMIYQGKGKILFVNLLFPVI